LLTCTEHLNSLHTLGSTVGVVAFGALAFLVAVVTVFIELNRDQIIVSRRFYLRLHWAVRILAAEVLAWISIEFEEVSPVKVLPCNSAFIVFFEVFMLLGLGIATLLLAGFVKQIGILVREGYH